MYQIVFSSNCWIVTAPFGQTRIRDFNASWPCRAIAN
jgi:hypothetical protein